MPSGGHRASPYEDNYYRGNYFVEKSRKGEINPNTDWRDTASNFIKGPNQTIPPTKTKTEVKS